MNSRFLKTLVIACCAFTFAAVLYAKPVIASADGVAEIAMEMESGLVLDEKNADARLPMASTTKIMTALIIAEESNLEEVVCVPDEAVGVEGSSIYLKHGEIISIRDLLYGLMLRSGNDAACALAIIHSGSTEKFVDKMNERARELGALNTHFKNPSGLPDSEHYTTARDLCNIARYAMQVEAFNTVVGTKSYTGDYRCFNNKNKLLNTLDGANGVKTGYTQKAGRCLVSSAKRDNMDVVCVVLNCYDMFERSTKIIENCFDKYAVETISGATVFSYRGIPCTLRKDVRLTVEKNCELRYEIKDKKDSTDRSVIGNLEIYAQNSLIFSHDLFTIE